MVEVIEYYTTLNPHLIFVIENPTARLPRASAMAPLAMFKHELYYCAYLSPSRS
jgi:hypothetical protein